MVLYDSYAGTFVSVYSSFIFSGCSLINKSTTQSSDTGADTLKDKILYKYEETHMKVWIYSNSLSWIWMCVPCYCSVKHYVISWQRKMTPIPCLTVNIAVDVESFIKPHLPSRILIRK